MIMMKYSHVLVFHSCDLRNIVSYWLIFMGYFQTKLTTIKVVYKRKLCEIWFQFFNCHPIYYEGSHNWSGILSLEWVAITIKGRIRYNIRSIKILCGYPFSKMRKFHVPVSKKIIRWCITYQHPFWVSRVQLTCRPKQRRINEMTITQINVVAWIHFPHYLSFVRGIHPLLVD